MPVSRRGWLLRSKLVVMLLAVPFLLAADKQIDPHGRPENFDQGKRRMYGVWLEEGTWHLRVTSKNLGKNTKRRIFNGKVEVTGDRLTGAFQGLEKAEKAKDADYIKVHRDGMGFEFQFATFGKSDGVTFKVGKKAETITFHLLSDGDDDPEIILIGAKGAHPESAKFTLPAQ